MKIMLTGGGTLGPVTPLLAVAEVWQRNDSSIERVWVGTPQGPERALVDQAGIRFLTLAAPKLDRYRWWTWPLLPFQAIKSLVDAKTILSMQKPDVLVSAGGYVSVPLVLVGKCLGIPSWIHQQDVRPGLANKLMAPFANGISVAWEKSMAAFSASKTLLIGNPVRASFTKGSKQHAIERFQLSPNKRTLLILGGGTGSRWINQSIAAIASDLVAEANVVHLTGKGKKEDLPKVPGYHVLEFVKEEMADLMAAADVVICRAGMGTISELAFLKKAAMIIPIPESHQEDNTDVLTEHRAAVIVDQRNTSPQELLQKINDQLKDGEGRKAMGERLNRLLPTHGVAEKLAEEILFLIK